MKTISEDEFASYLLRAKQKLAAPDALVDPLSQVVVANKGGSRGTKRGRKAENVFPSNKVAKLDGEVANSIHEAGDDETGNTVDEAGDGVQEERCPPKVTGGKPLLLLTRTSHRATWPGPLQLRGKALNARLFLPGMRILIP
jgi:hypothetical protein